MPLPSILQRKPKSSDRAPPPAVDSGPVQAARVRARRRLIGAVVLLAIGIVGFPLVFETQPRPIAPDVVFELPGKDRVPTPAVHPAPPAPAKASAPLPVPVPVDAAGQDTPQAPNVVTAPAPVAVAPPPAASATVAAAARPKADDGRRAMALLEGDTASAAKTARFVVQVGAFSDPQALRDARQKVERLGLKTYTQVVDTEAGKRTRVRIGPFASRDEADGAAAKLKSAGLPANILVL